MIPPAPTRIVSCRRRRGRSRRPSRRSRCPAMLWCSASQKRAVPQRSACCARSSEFAQRLGGRRALDDRREVEDRERRKRHAAKPARRGTSHAARPSVGELAEPGGEDADAVDGVLDAVNSSGVWLRPSLLRTKIIAVRRSSPSAACRARRRCASSATGCPARAAAASNVATTPDRRAHGGRSSTARVHEIRARAASATRASVASCSAKSRSLLLRVRMARVDVKRTTSGQRPGRFGSTRSRPIVVTAGRPMRRARCRYAPSDDLGEARHRVAAADPSAARRHGRSGRRARPRSGGCR